MIVRERLEDLVLARLSLETKSRPSPSDVLNSLFPYVESQLTRTEWRRELDRTLATLRERGAVEPNRLTLTPNGHERLAGALRMDSVPKVRSWTEFKKRYLPVLIDPEDRSGVRAGRPALALVARGLGLQLEHIRSEGAVANAWLAAALGVDERSVTLDSLRAALLARELGVPVRRSLRDVLRLSATKLSGAKSARPEDITKAVATRWLRETRESANGSTAPAPAPKPREVPESSANVVAKVRASLHLPGAKRFGANKVFIGSVWQNLRADPEVRALGEDGFKRLLIDAHQRGDLTLSRADLVSAMDPADVAASETRHLNATYHFVQVTGEPS